MTEGETRCLQRQALTPREDTRYRMTDVGCRMTERTPAIFRPLIPARPGGYSEGPTPDPIPNSAVKTLSANGTAP